MKLYIFKDQDSRSCWYVVAAEDQSAALDKMLLIWRRNARRDRQRWRQQYPDLPVQPAKLPTKEGMMKMLELYEELPPGKYTELNVKGSVEFYN